MTTTEPAGSPKLPPRWFVHRAWAVHRGLYRMTGGRFGLWLPGGRRGWGAMRLTIIGRRESTGEIRDVLFGSVANYVLHNVACPVLLF